VTPHERVYDPYGLLLNPDELRFRDELTQFLAGHEGIIARQFFRGRGGPARALYQELGSRGWLSMCWPEEFGGWCAPRSFEFILWDTLAFFRACRPDLGPGLIAHVLITKGSDELRQRVLPSLASGSLSPDTRFGHPTPTMPLRCGSFAGRLHSVPEAVASAFSWWTWPAPVSP